MCKFYQKKLSDWVTCDQVINFRRNTSTSLAKSDLLHELQEFLEFCRKWSSREAWSTDCFRHGVKKTCRVHLQSKGTVRYPILMYPLFKITHCCCNFGNYLSNLYTTIISSILFGDFKKILWMITGTRQHSCLELVKPNLMP